MEVSPTSTRSPCSQVCPWALQIIAFPADRCIDYRIPQMLYTLGCLRYSPPLESHVRQLKQIPSGHTWELQLRGMISSRPDLHMSLTASTGCTIWCVELIRREILRQHPEATVNAVLIDFFLYDTMKKREASGEETIPHHRTRSIWY